MFILRDSNLNICMSNYILKKKKVVVKSFGFDMIFLIMYFLNFILLFLNLNMLEHTICVLLLIKILIND